MRLIDADELILEIFNLRNCSNGYSDVYEKSFIIGMIEGQQTVELEQSEDKCSECDAWNKYKNYPQEQRWIPVSERLPDKSNFYICTKKNRLVKTVWYSVLEGAWEENVIAWMPLPEPYQEEGE